MGWVISHNQDMGDIRRIIKIRGKEQIIDHQHEKNRQEK